MMDGATNVRSVCRAVVQAEHGEWLLWADCVEKLEILAPSFLC